MLIGGWQKFTTLDYPGKIAAALFTVGCNFRCFYCHNAELVLPELIARQKLLAEEAVLSFLARRRGQLEGVCISGGEPTLQADLVDFLHKIKAMDYAIKLDTNGSRPEVVKEILRAALVDHWAVDVKTAFSKYEKVVSRESNLKGLDAGEKVLETLNLLASDGVMLELRTTMVPTLVSSDDFDEITEKINGIDKHCLRNLSRYSLQTFRPQKTLDPRCGELKSYGAEEMRKAQEKLERFGATVEIID